MKTTMYTALALMLGATSLPAADLSGDARITRELTAAAVADEIRSKCDSLSANMFTGLSKALSLKSYAKSIGASEDEIKQFLDSQTERSRIMGLRNDYLEKNGVVKGDEATYCTLGNREKAQGTLIGSLLR